MRVCAFVGIEMSGMVDVPLFLQNCAGGLQLVGSSANNIKHFHALDSESGKKLTKNKRTGCVASFRDSLKMYCVQYWLGVMPYLPHKDISFFFGEAFVTDLFCTVFSLRKVSEHCGAGTF